MINTRATLALFLLLIGAVTMNASGHNVWLESRDQADVGDSERLYALYGHLDDITGITAPAIESAFLLAPDGQKTDLDMNTGDWLPGYGWIGYAYSDMTYSSLGDYLFAVARTPSVYDPSWHGSGPSNPRLGYSVAKMAINVGNESNKTSWDTGLAFDINPDKAPYTIRAGENVTFLAKYNGQPVNATFSAFPNNAMTLTQTGSTGSDGSFMVNFSQGGLWQVSASYDINEPATWTATMESAGHYKIGDVVSYNTTRYSTYMMVYVRK
ncbi:MAG: DUF4198 domain-containing protein [Methanothrix sp.]|uniref:DUF4198 domain-containing protein n=1 Tax=Methanothrix sp. TaxID=90426 RepID=UPI0025F74BCC|nr:DUF4198 domain-containing protein [Methanothrix sp.]MCK9406182.1 DUF4198 domain-containing protein [Methanothrix sp.]